MLHTKVIKRDEDTTVMLFVAGGYDCLTGKLSCSYWAKVLRQGKDEWKYFYPLRKGEKAMSNTSVEEYLKTGWGSIVRTSELLKITLEFQSILKQSLL